MSTPSIVSAAARVEVEEVNPVALDRARPGVQPVGEALAEQPRVEVGHVERGQRGREERVPAADELDLAAAVEQHLADARDRPGAVVVEDDHALADGPLVEEHVPAREHVVLVDAGQRLDERVDAREAGAARDARRSRRRRRPGRARATSAGVASVPSRTSTPKRSSRRSRSVTIQRNSSRPGVRRIRFTWPPSSLLLLDERDLVAALGERRGRLQAGRAAAGDEPARRRVGGRQAGRRTAPRGRPRG